MLVYNYNSNLHKFKDLHDETGGRLKEFDFKYYDCFCGGEKYSLVSNATRHRNHFDIVQCSDCGTLRINPYMSDASIEKYYKEVYGPVKRRNMTAEALYTRQSRSAQEIFDILSPHVSKNAKILDFGSGAGGRMEKFQADGYQVYLQDHDKNYLDYGLAKGMQGFSDKETYDLIVLSHVLEHINEPVGFLQFIDGMLNKGGQIYIEVPLIENRKALLGDFQLAHKFYFSNESLSHLTELAGFKKTADFYNGILVTKGKPDIKASLRTAKRKSDAVLRRSQNNSLRTKIKMLFKKKPKKL